MNNYELNEKVNKKIESGSMEYSEIYDFWEDVDNLHKHLRELKEKACDLVTDEIKAEFVEYLHEKKYYLSSDGKWCGVDGFVISALTSVLNDRAWKKGEYNGN
jgi:hypothetical protein